MSTNMHRSDDVGDDGLRRLVAEMVAVAPSTSELLIDGGVGPKAHTPKAGNGLARRPLWAAAAALLLAAVIGGWWLSRPEVDTVVADDISVVEQPYRWTVTFPDDVDATFSGAVDPRTGWRRATLESEGEELDQIFDGQTVGIRYEGNGDLFALNGELTDNNGNVVDDGLEPEDVVGRWWLVAEGGPLEVEWEVPAMENVKTLELFEIEVWEDLGREIIDGVELQHVRTTETPSARTQETLSLFEDFALVRADEALDVWVRNDGAVARLALLDVQLDVVGQIDLFDFGVPIDTSWPDGSPPTERFPVFGQ